MDENSIESNNNNNNEELNQNSATKKPACEYCKKRKIKCDSNQPCFQCSKRDIDCEYIAPVSKPKTGVVAKLIKKVDRLNSKLTEQKKIADYWRNLYEDKASQPSQAKLPAPIIIEHKRQIASPRPILSESTQEFCSNVLAAVCAVRKAYLDVMKAIMPLNILEYDVEYASIFWNRLIGSVPADLVANIKNATPTTETIVQMFLHSSIFSLGSILLIDTIDEDLADHFNQCFNALFTIVSQIHIPSLQHETVKQMTLPLFYTMFYYKINGCYNEITSLWQLTSSMLTCKPGLDNESFAEFTLCLVLLDPTRAGFASTIPLDFSGSNQYNYALQHQILQVVSEVALELTTNKMDPEHNSYVWNCIQDVETKLEKLQPHYEFFGAWIYSLKSIFAVYMHGMVNEEVNKCITIALKLYSGITNRSQQVWLSRDLEYLHFILSKSQAQFQENYSLNVVLGTLYNIIAQMSFSNDSGIKTEPNNTNVAMESYVMHYLDLS